MSKFVLNVHSNEGTIYVYSNEVYKDPEYADQNIPTNASINLRNQQSQHPAAGYQNDSTFQTSQTRFPYTQQFTPAQTQAASNLPQTNSGTTSMNYPQTYSNQNPSTFWSFNPPYAPTNLSNVTLPLFNPKPGKSSLTKIDEEVKDTIDQKVDEKIKKDDFVAENKNETIPKTQNKKGKK